MLPLDHIKHRSNSGTTQASNSFDFHEWAYKHEEWLDALNMSLAKNVCHAKKFYLGLLEGEACQHIFEKSNIFNSFLSLQNLFSSSGLVKISASWSSVPTVLIQMFPFCWWSLIKWWRTSMCFVLACWTRFLVSLIALSLSHSNGTCLNLIQNHSKWPSSREFVHYNYR